MSAPAPAPLEAAIARSRAYGLLARLLVEGPTPALLARLAETPLAEALPEPAEPDELAAGHYSLFHLELHPYAGIFLDPEPLLGGASAAAFAETCRRHGFGAPLDDQADHLGNVLALLSFLVGAEADAIEDGRPGLAEQLRERQREVLDRWLLSWLLPFAGAALAHPRPLWSEVFELLSALSISHRAALGGPARMPALPDPPEDLLDDPQTGLKRIARALLTPSRSGAFLSRADIAALSRGQQTPAGFGGRLHTLLNLMHNAVEYGIFSELCEALAALFQARAEAPAALRGLPEAHRRPWLARASWSCTVLQRLARA